MERRVSDYRTKVENFWELTRAASPTCKVLLTCRTPYFRHRSEEEEILIPSHDRITVSVGEQVIDLHERKGFEVIHLLDFTDEDIQSALQKRLSVNWESAYKKIEETTNLLDLACRPVLLDMIVKTFPQFQDADRINLSTLYKTYVDSVLQSRWRSDSTLYHLKTACFSCKNWPGKWFRPTSKRCHSLSSPNASSNTLNSKTTRDEQPF